jgi:hypothetical protein
MLPFTYRCPNTGYRVQSFSAVEVSDNANIYTSVTCIICQRVQLVNPATGQVLSEKDE